MCYGPRLFLFFLPVASIPLIDYLDTISKNITLKNGLILSLMVLCFFGSAHRQLTVNYYPFWFDYHFVAGQNMPSEIKSYWARRSFADSIYELECFIDRSKRSQILLSYKLSGTDEQTIDLARKQMSSILDNVNPNYYVTFSQKYLRPSYLRYFP